MGPDLRTVIGVGLIVAAGTALLAPAPASAWCRMTTSASRPTPGSECVTDGIPLAWERRCIEYAIDARGSKDLSLDQVTAIVHASFGAWLAVECDGGPTDFDVREASRNSLCSRAEYHTDSGNVNTIAFVSDWDEREYDPAAYALTTVWHNTRTGQIYDADIEINEQRGRYGICPPPDGCMDGTIDLQNVLTHEAGHFFGLGHTQSEHSFATMYAVSPPGEVSKRVLRTDDIEGFCAMYPPGSLPDSCSFEPRHGRDLNCEEEEGCGCSAAGAPRQGLAWLLAPAALAAVVARRRRRRVRPVRFPPSSQV